MAKSKLQKKKDNPRGEFHFVVTKTYDSDGECIAISSSVVPGEFEPDERTKRYWTWLDERKAANGKE